MSSSGGLGIVSDCSLSIQIIHDRRQARLVPIGEIDVHSATTFSIAGEQAIAEGPEHLVIDLSQVTFMDSSGIRGVELLLAMAAKHQVPCTVVGRDESVAADESVVVWSGHTTRVVPKP
jgi:anti-anti-sigma factor